MSIINLKDVVKRYKNNLAVDYLNLEINEGTIFGLLGPNGAGKSTTIKMISGLLKIDSGEITVGGYDVKEKTIEAKKLLGLVPQDIAIYENLSAKDNVEFFGSLYGVPGKALRENSKEALEFAGLYDKRNDKPKSFSGGMKRRLNIACAIVHHPKIIIMDEPTVGIDPQSRNHILNSVKKLNSEGATVIYTSHYMEEIEAICSEVGIIDHGKLIAQGDKNKIKHLSGKEKKIKIEIADISFNPIEELKTLSGVQDVLLSENTITINTSSSEDILQDALFILSKSNVRVKNISIKEPDLESVFLSLTGRNLRD